MDDDDMKRRDDKRWRWRRRTVDAGPTGAGGRGSSKKRGGAVGGWKEWACLCVCVSHYDWRGAGRLWNDRILIGCQRKQNGRQKSWRLAGGGRSGAGLSTLPRTNQIVGFPEYANQQQRISLRLCVCVCVCVCVCGWVCRGGGGGGRSKDYRANNPPAVPSLDVGTPVWYSARSCDDRPAAAAAAA